MTGKTDREDTQNESERELVALEHRVIALERALEMVIARMPGGDYALRSPSDDPEWFC